MLTVLKVAVLACRLIVPAGGYRVGSVALHIIAAFGLLLLLCTWLVCNASTAADGEGEESG